MFVNKESKEHFCLRRASLGVSGEHADVADVRESEEEHHDTLETDSASGMRISAVREGLEISLQRVERDAMGLGTLREELGVMDTLGSRDDFLSTDEDIEGVGELLPMSHARNGNGVLGVGHGVEGTDGQRELVQDVEVGVVLLLDETSELLLHGRATSHGATATT